MFAKTCTKCSQTKQSTEFHNDKSRLDGKFPWCKSCTHANDTSDRRKELKNIRERGPKARARINGYRQAEEIKTVTKVYNAQYKASEAGKVSDRKTRKRYPEKMRARNAIRHAIRAGNLVKAENLTCSHANENCSGKMQYHHHLGYSEEYKLSVIPLCTYHHGIEKRKYRDEA